MPADRNEGVGSSRDLAMLHRVLPNLAAKITPGGQEELVLVRASQLDGTNHAALTGFERRKAEFD